MSSVFFPLQKIVSGFRATFNCSDITNLTETFSVTCALVKKLSFRLNTRQSKSFSNDARDFAMYKNYQNIYNPMLQGYVKSK